MPAPRFSGMPMPIRSIDRDVRSQPLLQTVLAALILIVPAVASASIAGVESLPAMPAEYSARPQIDWLIATPTQRADVFRGVATDEIILSNGLVSRTFKLGPDAATIALDNQMTGQSMLRGVKPETVISLDGKPISVGGLTGQPNYAYLLPKWLDAMKADPAAFHFRSFEVGKTAERFAWKRKRYSQNLPWPPPGVSLTLFFGPPDTNALLSGVEVAVHYELYDGIPLLAKWLTIRNDSQKARRLDSFTSEILAVVEYESAVDERTRWEHPGLHVASDFSFRGMDSKTADRTTNWVPDPQYETQVNYLRQTPCMLESRPPVGPAVDIPPGGGSFDTFRTFELLHDSSDRERQGMAVRRMYRTLAPWVTENPILMHVTRSDAASVRLAIDQSSAVGFEMVIMSFGSGFSVENRDAAYRKQLKELADYAHERHVELGGYSLLASRGDSGAENEVINPKTKKPGGAIFGNSPCLQSKWGEAYFRDLYDFYQQTGLDVLEHDGSYPGDVCASDSHPGHRGLDDSQWTQWQEISRFYQWCRGQGIYLNVPDFYFLNGSSKVGMGYRETNWSLPREQQLVHARQNIFDGTWEKTPSMGWMFVPLTQYHGGGDAATIEPLADHLPDYEAHLANYFGAGVQACYRGPRLYDSEKTQALVKKWVEFYKENREILDSDIVHVRRADGRAPDCLLHVNPRVKTRGLAVIYNPGIAVRHTVRLPLYYTGLTEKATVRVGSAAPKEYTLDRQWNIDVELDLEPHSATFVFIE